VTDQPTNDRQPVDPFTNIPPVDPGNPILAPTPVIWSTAQVETPHGPRLAVTLRTTSTTLTLLLEREHAARLGSDITRAAGQMSSLIIPNGLLG
jgi:hypothetical protein